LRWGAYIFDAGITKYGENETEKRDYDTSEECKGGWKEENEAETE
jgi:hypothetical protein